MLLEQKKIRETKPTVKLIVSLNKTSEYFPPSAIIVLYGLLNETNAKNNAELITKVTIYI